MLFRLVHLAVVVSVAAKTSSQHPRFVFGLWIILYLLVQGMLASVIPALGGGGLAFADGVIERSKPMSTTPSGVMAAPNKCRIEAPGVAGRARRSVQRQVAVHAGGTGKSVNRRSQLRANRRADQGIHHSLECQCGAGGYHSASHNSGYRGVPGRCTGWRVPAVGYPGSRHALRFCCVSRDGSRVR